MSSCCPICSATGPAKLDEAHDAPILMNRLYPTAEAGRAAPRGRLAWMGCQRCGFVWNAAFDPHLIRYDGAYENDQTHSPAFARHLSDRATDVAAAVRPPAPIDFLEVGCGQGVFIRAVAGAAGARLRSAEGFDPAWRGGEDERPAGARIHGCYFDAAAAGRLAHAPNVVATRHTIEHVPDPVGFLTAIREALGADARATVFVETPCVEWILEREAMQDFFYEHCSLFTAASLADALQRAGFHAPKVEHVFGGQYLWARATTAAQDAPAAVASPDRRPLAGVRKAFTDQWRAHAHAADGPIALWGAGAKGVNFALMVDPEGARIDHVVDINPAKQGRHLPGSGLPVLSPAEAAARRPRTIYVMNPNYLAEIRAMAAEAGVDAELVPIN